MATQYTLKYFDVTAKGELARILFHAGGQSFVDERISNSTMAELKPTLVFGQLPVLEINGQQYAQSAAIANYLAREFGFYGKTKLEQLQIDQVTQHIQDMFPIVAMPIYLEQDAEKKADKFKTLREETIPRYLQALEKLLEKNKTGYFAGSQLSLADMAVFDICDLLTRNGLLDLATYPLIEANREKVSSHANIAKYLKERKLD